MRATVGINSAAKSVGRSPATLRRWERLGLVSKPRRDSMTRKRVYTQPDLDALARLVGHDRSDEQDS